jgi:nucleotidyltransferase/DNA polymerase involved in DNA repair
MTGIGVTLSLARAASLHKPDGLDVIDHTNVLQVYGQVKLLDLSGINTRYQARLNAHGIFTPMEFYNAPSPSSKTRSSGASMRIPTIAAIDSDRSQPSVPNEASRAFR